MEPIRANVNSMIWATGLAARYTAALLVLLACCDAQDSLRPSADYYEMLVAQPSRLARHVEKKGMVPVELWEDSLFRHEPFDEWVMNSSIYMREVPRNYPMSYACGVWINYHYKFIFIRNRKAASTTVTDNFAKCHYDGADQKRCIQVANAEGLRAHGITDPAAMWRDYFVFTTSRNPWSRAGSSYDYCSSKWRRTDGPCRKPPFPAFARDPSILGKISNLFNCFDNVGKYHDYYHTEPVAPCITTAEGLPAVDFIVRYENLSTDLPEAFRIINERRDPSLPPLPEPEIYWKKKGLAARIHEKSGVDSSTAALVGHGDKYQKCGIQCVRDIYDYFRADFELFQIPMPEAATDSTQQR